MTVLIRPSVGTLAVSRSASLAPGPTMPGSSPKENWLPAFSSERSAFWSASVKLRPMAMASPTDFMVVVRLASAAGNFSKAKRGTLTTT